MEVLQTITVNGIDPALALLPTKLDTVEARVMLLATGLQESRFQYRRQIIGPARGYWQFEQGGGVYGAMRHPASRDHLQALCAHRGVLFDSKVIWTAIEFDDVLAAGLARLLYWTDPRPLPSVDDEAGAWNLYLRTWRPGKPHRNTWPAQHIAARQFLGVA